MASDVNEISSCEVCGSTVLEPVLDLGSHPMCDDLVPVGDPRVSIEYPIDILYCDTCRTAHQRFQVPKADLFPTTYHYRARFTADVLDGMKSLVAACEARFGALAGKLVLDIGCNDGSLLGFFKERGARTVGIEPTGAAADAKERVDAVYNAFLEEDVAAKVAAAHGTPDVIVFTNVFAHIEDLRGVIRALGRVIGPGTVVVVENHYLGAVLDGNQFDTFYHEHPRTYSYTSFVHVARALKLDLLDVEFPARYGGNIRVFMGPSSLRSAGPATDLAALEAREAAFRGRFATMRENIARWRVNKSQEIARLVERHGPLRAKAFPGRAAILVKLLGLDETSVCAVHEKVGSKKIGHYLPGTRIPIRSDDELFALADKSAPLLNLAWHISPEIRGYLAHGGYTGPVIDILSSGDPA